MKKSQIIQNNLIYWVAAETGPDSLDPKIWTVSGTDLDRIWTVSGPGWLPKLPPKFSAFVAEFPNKFCAFVGPYSQQRGHQDPHFALKVVM